MRTPWPILAVLLPLLLQENSWEFGGRTIREAYQDDYHSCCTQALKENKPLCVWIGYYCQGTESLVLEAHHCLLRSGHELFPKVQGVVVSAPQKGKLIWLETLEPADVCATNIRRALAREQKSEVKKKAN